MLIVPSPVISGATLKKYVVFTATAVATLEIFVAPAAGAVFQVTLDSLHALLVP
jgi:hypothetical protein